MIRLAYVLLVFVLAAGCASSDKQEPSGPAASVLLAPLSIQQSRIYEETATGLYVSLVDFENAGDQAGFEQTKLFTVSPAGRDAHREFVVNTTRTGVGAMEVNLPAKASLTFAIPGYSDFTGYRLLSFSLFSESLRDDLRVKLTTDSAAWTSHRTLVRPGWNTILIDIQRLESQPGFDITAVRSIEWTFANAAGPVRFNLDDILLVDNARRITQTPAGIELHKSGLDFRISLPYRGADSVLSQQDDGLWRLDRMQPTVQIVAPDAPLPPGGEKLERMGQRKLGTVEIIERNSVRLRIANTWYFPTRAGEWLSLSVRRIRWEYTFYGDGRWVTHVELNNAGGAEIGAVRMWLDSPVAWSTGAIGNDLMIRQFTGPVGQWSYLAAAENLQRKTLHRNYIRTGRLVVLAGEPEATAAGDIGRDGFDESQGCYFLKAVNGRCRFRIDPPDEGLLNPVFRVAGPWRGKVYASGEGLAIRQIVRSADDSVLFIAPGWIRRSLVIEVVSKP